MRIKIIGFLAAIAVIPQAMADTIANYQHISRSIPKMELKADEKSQAWARSARHVLTITNESIAETLVALNDKAMQQGHPFFCLPKNKPLNAKLLSLLLQEATVETNRNNENVSQVALDVVMQKFPCNSMKKKDFGSVEPSRAAMQHASADS